MEKRDLIYEGKAKKVYATDDPANVIVCYKDDATAFDGMKKGIICGKGVVNNRMSNYLMQKLSEKGIPTHFLEELNDRETLVRKVAIIPLEIIVRLSSAISPPGIFPAGTEWRKELFLIRRLWSFLTRMMSCTILC